VFLNEFADEQELFRYLYASDIYITPYLNEAQITSGTLSYAVGVGSAVVSTPYWHAAELLAENRGKLFDFGNHDSLAKIIISLLDNPETLHELKINAQEYGQKITWPKTGEKYLELANSIVQNGVEKSEKENLILDPLILPPFSLNHIIRMTDDTGIIQHAKFGIPSLKEGYCLDDNARALLMVLMAYRQRKDMSALDLLPIYLSYINYMQNPDGTFRNFMSFNRNFLDEVGSEDSFGRTIWALGYLLRNPPNDAYYQAGKSVFFHAATCFESLKSLRGIANSIIGICHYLKSNPSDDSMTERLRNLAYKLVKSYDENKTTDWKWFESLLAYDNGILPLALLSSSEILNEEKITQTAFLSMDFLEKHTFKENFLSVIGNDKWYKKGGERSFFAQQPIDAMAMVLMYYQTFQITKDNQYLVKLYKSFLWFLGENDLRMSLYDFETQGCCDGFEHYGVNRNQGAESSLAYLISHLTVLQAFQEYYETGQNYNTI